MRHAASLLPVNYMKSLQKVDTRGQGETAVSSADFMFHNYIQKPFKTSDRRFHSQLFDLEPSRGHLMSEASLFLPAFEEVTWAALSPLGVPTVFTLGERAYQWAPMGQHPDNAVFELAERSRRVDEYVKVADRNPAFLKREWVDVMNAALFNKHTCFLSHMDVVRARLGLLPSLHPSKVPVPVDVGLMDIKFINLPPADKHRLPCTDRLFSKGRKEIRAQLNSLMTTVPLIQCLSDLSLLGEELTTNRSDARQSIIMEKLIADVFKPSKCGRLFILPQDHKTKDATLINALGVTMMGLWKQLQFAMHDRGAFDCFKASNENRMRGVDFETYFGEACAAGDEEVAADLETLIEDARGQFDALCQKEFMLHTSSVPKGSHPMPTAAFDALQSTLDYIGNEDSINKMRHAPKLQGLFDLCNTELQFRKARNAFLQTVAEGAAEAEEPTQEVDFMDENQDLSQRKRARI